MNSKNNAEKQKKNKTKRNPFRFAAFDFIKITGALSVLIWLRPKRLYENQNAKKHIRGGAVIIANHTNFIDPVALLCAFWYRRIYMMTIQELFRHKLANLFFRGALCIPVDRDNFNMNTYHAAAEALSDGRLLAIFPEGKINTGSSIVNPFKSGAVLIALKGRVPIVPIYIVPPKKWYHRTVVVLGEPVDPEKICGGTPKLSVIEDISHILREKELKLTEVYCAWKTKKSSK